VTTASAVVGAPTNPHQVSWAGTHWLVRPSGCRQDSPLAVVVTRLHPDPTRRALAPTVLVRRRPRMSLAR
jgi:hypothetical protein